MIEMPQLGLESGRAPESITSIMKITILGAGAMGAALTVPFTDRGHRVALWSTELDHKIYRALKANEPHPDLQSHLPDKIEVFHSDQIGEAMAGADLLVLSVSTAGVLPVLRQARPHLRSKTPILTAAKGFLSINGETEPVPSAIQRELQELSTPGKPPIFCSAGPSIAGELVHHRPTAAAIGGPDFHQASMLCEKLTTDYFWLDAAPDTRGLEICLAYKNIYSITLSWAEGLSESTGWESARNLFAILLLQAVGELRKLIQARQGNPDTAYGWAGLGDLAATAGGGRNGRFGHLLGTGKRSDEAAEILEKEGITTIEGRAAAPDGVDYANQTFGSEWATHLPLLKALVQVLEGRKTVRKVVSQIHQFRGRLGTAGNPPGPQENQ